MLVAANCRAACRGRSTAEWFAKPCICVAGADETQLWLKFLGEAEIVPKPMLVALKQENLAIVSAFVGARKPTEEKRSVK